MRGRWKLRVGQIVYVAFSPRRADDGLRLPQGRARRADRLRPRDVLPAADLRPALPVGLRAPAAARRATRCASWSPTPGGCARRRCCTTCPSCPRRPWRRTGPVDAGEWGELRPLLHPYLHFTDGDGRRCAAGQGARAPARAPDAAAADGGRGARRADLPLGRGLERPGRQGVARSEFSRTSYYFAMTDDARSRWQARYDAARQGGVRDGRLHDAVAGWTVEPAYGTDDSEWPGEFPFTRGLYPTGYRGRTWTIRQFAGFGNAEQTNERYRMILGRGGGGLSRRLRHADPDGPRLRRPRWRSARSATAAWPSTPPPTWSGSSTDIDLGDGHHVDDDQRPGRPGLLHDASSPPSGPGVDTGMLNGTLQTDIFKEYIAQKEWLFGPEPHLRLIGDLMEYCAEKIPAYKPLSVSGYHIREAGSTAAQELAFTLADGFGYVELGLSRGLDVDVFAPGPVVLLRRPRRLLRGDRQVPRGPPDLGALDARRLRRQDREGAVAAVPHPDRRRLADRPAALQQRRPHRHRGARRGARRHQLAAHQRPRRDPRPAAASRPPRSRCAPSR